MAWRPGRYIKEGHLRFEKGKVTGFLSFVDYGNVVIDLKQNFVTSGELKFEQKYPKKETIEGYFQDFERKQTGVLSIFTSGNDGFSREGRLVLEWYSEKNGRIVVEFVNPVVNIIEAWQFDFSDNHEEEREKLFDNFVTEANRKIVKDTGEPIITVVVSPGDDINNKLKLTEGLLKKDRKI